MRERTTIVFLIALLALMTFMPVLYSGYTTQDDVYNAMGIGDGWRSPWIFDAQRSGRLQHVVAGQMMPLAYGWGIYWLMKTVSLAAIVTNVLALYLVLRVLTGDSRLGILAVTFFFAFIQNTWDHNLLTAYPFILHAALTVLLLSMVTWWMALQARAGAPLPRWADRLGSRRLAIISATLFSASLFGYENFMTYTVVFPALTIAAVDGPWRERLLRAAKTPHLAVLGGFIVAVVLFRVFLYTGQGFNAAQGYEVNPDPRAILKVLERYGASAMPMHYFKAYRDLINDFHLGFGTFRARISDIFKVFEVAWLVKGAIVAFLVGMVVSSRTLVRRRTLVVVIALVLMVLTNLPLAITSKYQGWVIDNFSHGYLTSYFVLFGVTMLFAVMIDSAVGAIPDRWRQVRRALVGLVAAAAFLVSYGTDFLNAHVSASQRQMFDKWPAVDAWLASPYFQNLPEESIVFAPSLWEHYPGQTHLNDDYWSFYVRSNGKKIIHMVNLAEEFRLRARAPQASQKLFYLKFMRERRGDASFLVFGRVVSSEAGMPLASTDVSVLSHSKSDHLRMIGRLYGVDTHCRARLYVDGVPTSGTFDSTFGAHVDRPRSNQPWLWTRLLADGAIIDPESVAVFESTESVDGQINVTYGDGFFQDEVAHRWAKNEAMLTLLNRSDRPITVDVEFQIRAPWTKPGAVHHLEVTAGQARETWPVEVRLEKRSIRAMVPARASVDVQFKTDAPRIDPAVDGRNLVLMFVPPIRTTEVGCGS